MMKKLAILLGLMLVAGVALTGCSSKTTSTKSTSTSEAPPAPPATDAIPQDTGN